ncbi:hypothetical protein, partial [uncultured Dubosiella sp.]
MSIPASEAGFTLLPFAAFRLVRSQNFLAEKKEAVPGIPSAGFPFPLFYDLIFAQFPDRFFCQA